MSFTRTLLSTALLLTTARADWSGFGGRNGNGGYPWSNGDDDGGDGGSSSSGSSTFGQGSVFSSAGQFDRATHILIAHAVLASLVWVLFIPSLAILLRLNIKNPIVLRIHAVGQVLSYVLYIAAAGMGIWLAEQFKDFGVWDDPHPRMGLAVLALAFFQPVFGYIHHRIYKKRALKVEAGQPTKAPGRTPAGRAHLWLGRILIVLGIVTGGLGIKLASESPLQTDSQSRTAKIAYAVVAAVMFALYLFFVVAFEIRRARQVGQDRQTRADAAARKETGALPTYDESEESVGRSTRYR
ncbi:hypothetical protein PV08_09346 [Exophiala spinifera]|uniref:Cytochrome b561 domain-containing protein n=1 Tax=Exophiala spinifera TaxID=91928 RepID=A0A0D1ZGH9_9EURO|nr:uncharacterized protein PV08_09346 [Exophiala spinifera]KIW12072.1 hypothetical protein PV08_09346 [Exophiala spinifera]